MAKPMANDLLLGPRSPPVRLCAECATRHHDRAVSRTAQVPLCTLCEASYDIIIGQTPPPAAGEAIPGGATGSSARRGQRRCPRCRGLVSSVGYSWVHHMRWAAPLVQLAPPLPQLRHLLLSSYASDRICDVACRRAAGCRMCDPVYFHDEIERDASVLRCDIAELEFLRPIDYSDMPCVPFAKSTCREAAGIRCNPVCG